jgi:hypothetical protein
MILEIQIYFPVKRYGILERLHTLNGISSPTLDMGGPGTALVIIVTMLWAKQLRICGVIPGTGQKIFSFSKTTRPAVGPN